MTKLEEIKEQLYTDLRGTIKLVPVNDRLVLIGDFNARIDSDMDK